LDEQIGDLLLVVGGSLSEKRLRDNLVEAVRNGGLESF
jgi:hypothetical protein